MNNKDYKYIKEYKINSNKDAILVIYKDVNITMYNSLFNILNRLLENNVKNIIIYFKNIKYIISNAIYLILEVQKVLEFRNGKIIITGLNEYAKWSIKSCEAHKKIYISDNIYAAIKELTA
ncbi:hypothetical protein [Brachyspira alvinipulli]|uniref:hypothetical protein n=1 Tax=Brachyspira alvinipulli TaxID=84379 RepID=UPI000480109F|nr:hypothetical protein [Brachyspira alvinipulli]